MKKETKYDRGKTEETREKRESKKGAPKHESQ
jgi:hypothetical protein